MTRETKQNNLASVIQILHLMLLILTTISLLSLFCPNGSHAKKKEGNDEAETPVDDYYRAIYRYSLGKYATALTEFRDVEAHYPNFSRVKQAKIMQIYIQYLQKEYSQAVESIDGFFTLYPNNEYTAYLDYMRALCYYRQITGLTKAYEIVLKTKLEMTSVYERHKNTIYGKRAKKYLAYIDALIVYNELDTAQFYQQDRSYFAAIRRYNEAINLSLNTMQVDFLPIIYFRLYECYKELEMEDISEHYLNKMKQISRNFTGRFAFNIEGVMLYIPGNNENKKVRFGQIIFTP